MGWKDIFSPTIFLDGVPSNFFNPTKTEQEAPSWSALDELIKNGSSGSDIASIFGLNPDKYGGYFDPTELTNLQKYTTSSAWQPYRQAMFQLSTNPIMAGNAGMYSSIGGRGLATSGIYNRTYKAGQDALAAAGFKAEQSYLEKLLNAKQNYSSGISDMYSRALNIKQGIEG